MWKQIKIFSLEVTSAGGSFDGEPISDKGTTVVVGISAETSLYLDIRRYLETQTTSVLAVLLLQAKPDRLRNAGDAVALANIVKKRVSAFVKQQNASRLLLFYNGPAGGACFIGHRLNKVYLRNSDHGIPAGARLCSIVSPQIGLQR